MISPSGALSWKEDDQIAVWTSNGSSGKFCTFSLYTGAGTSSATFLGTPDEGYSVTTLAVYPAEAAVSYSDEKLTVNYPDSYEFGSSSAGVRMAAWFESTSDVLSFKHLGGMLSFKFSGVPSWVNCLRLTTSKPVHGNFTVLEQGGEKVVSSTASSPDQIEISFGKDSVGEGPFEIPVPAGTYDFTVALYCKDADDYYLCSKTSCSTNAPKKVSRKSIVQMRAIPVAEGIAEGFVQGMASLSANILSAEETTVADGLTRLDVSCRYTDPFVGTEESDMPRKVFVFKVDLSRMTLRTTIADDDESRLWTLQKTTDQLRRYASLHGVTVYGGVNGDFYDREALYSALNTPYGVVYRGGRALKDTFSSNEADADWSRTFALLNNGTAKIWHSEASFNSYAFKSSISEAVSGRLSVLQNGNPVTRADETLSPRTGIGIDNAGNTVWLAVVDGRDSGVSAGASSGAMGVIFKALGAYNAFNLDGGGSSTFACLENGDILLVNSPSDSGGERPVPNALAMCPREGDFGADLEDMSVRNNVEL
ncbi:MAG: phosphodiester glycosidase family protein [Bacteroidales bacterium]|nr:phosphodiester glycosidase family protein [Bacteroidales bacterium]